MSSHHGHVPGPFDPKHMHAREESRRAEMPPEEVLREFVPADAQTLVDLGCGSGFFTVAAARAFPGLRVLALDRQQDMLDFVARRVRAQGLDNVETILAEAPRLPLPDAQIDALLMSHVFHDIPERAEMRDEVFRVLRPGGVFFLVEWERLDTPQGPPQEIRIAVDDLAGILSAGGFRVERITHGPGSSYRLLARKPA